MSEPSTNPEKTPRPSERADEPVDYPENSVVGVVDDVDQVEAAVEALTSGGFLRSEIDVLHGQAAAERLEHATGRSGLTGLAMRLVKRIGMPDDETAVKDRYATALDHGRFVVVVHAPTDERRERAELLLRDHGGHFVNFLGRFTIEPMRL
ncbi:MAG TPA: hypothetical protein VFS08_09890 [Gemmatimonadaceae bacterium]|nr:hypothetical protein [Gemmatimonadaceae bacterium]